MTVSIKNVANGAGWGGYTLLSRPGARAIMGDVVLGDEICKSIDYKSGNSVNFVISFADEDNVTPQQSRKIAKEFMKSFMHGFKEDEYHLDLVEHTDTDHIHYHARVPKVNLLTGTQLKLYWHKTDLKYKKAVINEICHKYGLVTGEEMKNTIPNPMHKLNQINKWREEHSQEPLDLASPKLRRATEKKLSEYISEGVKAGLINSLDEVKAELLSLGLDIPNEGYDRGKEFHYLTIENESGKTRLRGDIYSAEFYGLTREDRQKSVRDNRSFTTRDAELKASGADVKQALQRERNKRLKFIEKQYGRARERAYQAQDARSIEVDNQRDDHSLKGLGESYGHNTEEPNRSPSTDSQRGGADSKASPRLKQRSITDTREPNEAASKNERAYSHYPSLDAPRPSRRNSDRVVSTEAKTKNSGKNRREESSNKNSMDNQKGDAKRRRRRLLREGGEGEGIFRKGKLNEVGYDKEQIDDSIRAEINDSIRATAGSFYRRIETDNSIISREYERSEERDSEAERDVKALRERVHELADKHQSRTAGRIGEEAEREGEELDGAVSEASRKQSAISKSYAGLERELNGAVARVGEKAGEVSEARRGFAGAVKRCIEKAIEKVREVAKEIQQSYSRGPTMMR